MLRTDPSIAVSALRSAAPYIRMYKGKVFVIKASGGVFGDTASTRTLIEQVAILHQVGIRVVLVHGGGPQLTQIQETLGIKPQIVAGRRVTDEKSIEVTSMVLNGLVNTQILGICRELDVAAVGVSGVDAGLVRAHKRPPVTVEGKVVDYSMVKDAVLVQFGTRRSDQQLVTLGSLAKDNPGIIPADMDEWEVPETSPEDS